MNSKSEMITIDEMTISVTGRNSDLQIIGVWMKLLDSWELENELKLSVTIWSLLLSV